MTLLVLGSTGLLGQAITETAIGRGVDVVGAARSGADRSVDVRDTAAVTTLLEDVGPALIVNCVALVDLAGCEADPGLAYAVNARPVATLADHCHTHGARLVQISTDHYWTGDGADTHDESAPVVLLNEYARTKYAGEAFALTAPGALVVRTNIVGRRGWKDRPTFAEWAIAALEACEPIRLFGDFHTSSLDTQSCADAILDLVDLDATGVLNVASSEVSDKKRFVEALAVALGLPAPESETGSVKGLAPVRAESLGLDVACAEGLLQRRLPNLEETVTALARSRSEIA